MIKIWIILLCFLVAILAIDVIRTLVLIGRSGVLTKNTNVFERSVPGAEMRILVLGDSTAYGTGSTRSEDSTAGRLGKLYPNAEVINLSVNGLKINGLIKILDKMDPKDSFDIILIQIGANDIIRLTPMEKIRKGIVEVLEKVKSHGGQIILLHSGDIGASKFFPRYIRPLMTMRTYQVREVYKSAINSGDVSYVDLLNSTEIEKMRDDLDKYYAPDYLHLNNVGYGLWFEEIKKHIKK